MVDQPDFSYSNFLVSSLLPLALDRVDPFSEIPDRMCGGINDGGRPDGRRYQHSVIVTGNAEQFSFADVHRDARMAENLLTPLHATLR